MNHDHAASLALWGYAAGLILVGVGISGVLALSESVTPPPVKKEPTLDEKLQSDLAGAMLADLSTSGVLKTVPWGLHLMPGVNRAIPDLVKLITADIAGKDTIDVAAVSQTVADQYKASGKAGGGPLLGLFMQILTTVVIPFLVKFIQTALTQLVPPVAA